MIGARLPDGGRRGTSDQAPHAQDPEGLLCAPPCASDETLESLASALDLSARQPVAHTRRVTTMLTSLGAAFGLSEGEVGDLRRGTLIHDLGMLCIPDAILRKPGPPTDEEWSIIRQHPAYAETMISPLALPRRVADIPRFHHERWDGSGYPGELAGEEIPLPARIFAVVDVWDTLRSDRPYRASWPEEEARDYVAEQAGKEFDPAIAKFFLNFLEMIAGAAQGADLAQDAPSGKSGGARGGEPWQAYLAPSGDNLTAPLVNFDWMDRDKTMHEFLLRDLPPGVLGLAGTSLACRLTIRLMSLLWTLPRTASSAADLAYRLNVSEQNLRPALTILEDLGVVVMIDVVGSRFYRLTYDPRQLVIVAAFCNWRTRWLERLHRMTTTLEAE